MATTIATAEKKMNADEKHERKPQRARVDDKFKIFCGTANQPLADEVCAFLGMSRGLALVRRFADGEAYVQIQENVRGADVFVMQPTCRPVDQHLMELLLMIDALKRASARRITAVMPYYGYGRQDRKDKPRAPISAKLVADLLTTAGADRALLIDPHAPQIQGFFNIPVDHLFASPVLVDHFKKLQLPNLTVVSPDAGGVERALRSTASARPGNAARRPGAVAALARSVAGRRDRLAQSGSSACRARCTTRGAARSFRCRAHRPDHDSARSRPFRHG